MGVKLLKELVAYQLAQAFKREVYRLIDKSEGASRDFRFKDQLRDSASGIARNIAEGFRRFGAAEVAHFVNIALGSLAESKVNLIDGIDRRYFTKAGCAHAFHLAKRCDKATKNFHVSLQPFIRARRQPRQPRQKLEIPHKAANPDPENVKEP
jgi:four helix bundle protein